MFVPLVCEDALLSVLAAAPIWQPPRLPTVLLAAHPGDEILGAGALIATLRRMDCEVTVITVTDGENGDSHRHLVPLRHEEQTAALSTLGVHPSHMHSLHLPDDGLTRQEEALYAALVTEVSAEVHLIAPWDGSLRPVHATCGRVAIRLAKIIGIRLTSYFLWNSNLGAPDLTADLPLVRLPVAPDLRAAKREAQLCQASRWLQPEEEPMLPASFAWPAGCDAELFLPTWDPLRTSPEFFDAKYRADPDPWNFASSPSETLRYDATLAALAGRRFHHAVEPACSVGVLTGRLARLCDRVSAFDLSPTAVARARERCADLPNVEICCASLIELHPDPTVDLLVLSEIGYYFTTEAWTRILEQLLTSLSIGCTVLGVHWLGVSQDHVTGGDDVHTTLRANSRLQLLHEERHEAFRLDLFQVVPASQVVSA